MELKIKTFTFSLFLCLFSVLAFSDVEKIKQKAETYLDAHEITGLIVGIIGGPSHKQLIPVGNISKKSAIPMNRFTELRIGPLTQIFTAAVLAYFVHEGRLSLDDPVSKFLPKSMKLPEYDGTQITLEDLATHTSGLPDMPYNLVSRSSFSVNQMYRFLTQYQLKRKPGTEYEYSNLGYAFLSNLLMRVAKRAFPDLMKEVLLTPLDLDDTRFFLTREQKTRHAIGYEKGFGIPPIQSEKIYSVFIGAEGLFSTAQDLLNFLSFNLGKEKTSLNAILPIMLKPYHSFKNFQTGLGWKIVSLAHSKVYVIDGVLFGFSGYIGIMPKEGIGVFVISNQGDFSINSLGEDILSLLTDSKTLCN